MGRCIKIGTGKPTFLTEEEEKKYHEIVPRAGFEVNFVPVGPPHMRGGPPSTKYCRSESQWVESASFLEWFRTLFPLLLLTYDTLIQKFVDGHQSHASLPLVETAWEQGIILYSFPHDATHLLHPFDVGFYGPLKQVWSQVLKGFKLETNVDKEVFPKLIAHMWP